jgi:hypothetical protein
LGMRQADFCLTISIQMTTLDPPSPVRTIDTVLTALSYCYLTSMVVLAGMWVGTYWLPPADTARGYLDNFASLDGRSYAEIARIGYRYDPRRTSTIVFFPAFPLAGKAVAAISGLRAERALLLVAWSALAAAFVVFAMYVVETRGDAKLMHRSLLALGIWPSTMFMRMAYTEALFLLVVLLAMYGMQRRWPTLLIAVVIGLATAVRPPGIALLPVFVVYLWQSTPRGWRFAWRAVPALAVACWGLAAYMLYLWSEFGDPLIFAGGQRSWMHQPAPWTEKWASLLSLRPVWGTFVQSFDGLSESPKPFARLLTDYRFWNPVMFVATIGLVSWGAYKRSLAPREWLMAACLLLFAYVSVGHDNQMLSQPRFASVVFPVYLVLGELLARGRWWLIVAFTTVCGLSLATFAAAFAANYGATHKILY